MRSNKYSTSKVCWVETIETKLALKDSVSKDQENIATIGFYFSFWFYLMKIHPFWLLLQYNCLRGRKMFIKRVTVYAYNMKHFDWNHKYKWV